MKHFFRAVTFTLLSAGVAHAQDWRQELAEDIVTIEGGKMTYTEYGIFKVELPAYAPVQLQVKLQSEAPVGGIISRDNFVALSTFMYTTWFYSIIGSSLQVSAGEFLAALDYEELNAPIGTPDWEMDLIITDEGMQLALVDNSTGETTRQTLTWAEIYRK